MCGIFLPTEKLRRTLATQYSWFARVLYIKTLNSGSPAVHRMLQHEEKMQFTSAERQGV